MAQNLRVDIAVTDSTRSAVRSVHFEPSKQLTAEELHAVFKQCLNEVHAAALDVVEPPELG